MATMLFRAVDCAVVYVDPAATGANTGATPADALTALPTPSLMAGGTVYLLRRGLTVAASYALGLTTCPNDNIAIMGMPLPTDTWYQVVPAEAKTAWDADAVTHPILATTNQDATSPTFSGVHITMHRVDFRCGHTTAIGSGAANYAILFTGDFVEVTSIKFRSAFFDLLVDTDISASRHCPSFYISAAVSRIADSAFQSMSAIGAYNMGAYVRAGLYVNSPTSGVCVVENCSFVYSNTQCQGSTTPFESSACLVNTRYAVVRNCTFDYAEGCTIANYFAHRRGLLVFARIARLHKLTFTARRLSFVVNPTAWASTQQGTYAEQFIQFPTVSVLFNGTATVADGYRGDIDIDTVSIDANGLRWAPSGIEVVPPSEYNSGAGEISVKVKNCTFAASQSRFTYYYVHCGILVPSVGAVVENCVVNYADCATAFASKVININTYAVNNSYYPGGSIFRNCTGSGVLLLGGIAYGDFPTFTVPASDIIPPIQSYGGPLHIGALTAPAGWGNNTLVSYGARQDIFIDSCNVPMVAAVQSPGGYRGGLLVANSGAAGVWYADGAYVRVQSTNVYRTGGATAALYVQSKSASAVAGSMVTLAPKPLAAKSLTAGGIGMRKVTVYLAAKGFTTEQLIKMLFIEIAAAWGGATAVKTYNSNSGVLLVDASQWNGDTGLDVYRLEIPVRNDRNEDLGFRLSLRSGPVVTSYVYIDPKVDVSAI